MTLIKKIKDKKVNFEFNKEYINVVTSKIANNDAQFITNSFNEIHPADAADIIEHLSEGRHLGWMGWRCECANHFLDLPGFYQSPHIHSAVGPTVVIGDSGEVGGTLPV